MLSALNEWPPAVRRGWALARSPCFVHFFAPVSVGLNPFTTGNPFLGTTLLGSSMGRDSAALKRLTPLQVENRVRDEITRN